MSRASILGRAPDLDTAWQAYSADHVPPDAPSQQRVRQRRDFMSGALAVLELQKRGASREQLLAEVVAFGRAVGSQAESAV